MSYERKRGRKHRERLSVVDRLRNVANIWNEIQTNVHYGMADQVVVDEISRQVTDAMSQNPADTDRAGIADFLRTSPDRRQHRRLHDYLTKFKSESFMINVGKVAELRESLHLTQQEMARELQITNVQLSLIENSKSFPSRALIDRFRDKFEVDLYILAWCRDQTSANKIPASLRRPAAELARAWEERFKTVVKRYQKKEGQC